MDSPGEDCQWPALHTGPPNGGYENRINQGYQVDHGMGFPFPA
ncbi:hypothetical protein QE357_001648 [Siphonobacter sp. BAB-5404]|nr:hypothetical protein [Siphonobacter sp. SORGH_AS_0500]